MSFLKNLRVGTKILAGFIVVAIISGIIAFDGITNINAINASATRMYENNTLPLQYLGKMANDFQDIRIQLREVILYTDKASMANAANKINTDSSSILKNMDSLRKSVKDNGLMARINDLQSMLNQYEPVKQQTMELGLANKNDQATALLHGQNKVLATNIINKINEMYDYDVSITKKADDANSQLSGSSTNTMVIFMFLGIFIAIGLGIIITKAISNPVKMLTEAAEKLSVGDINVSVKADSKDELGTLMNSFEKMVHNIQSQADIAQKIAEGDLSTNAEVKSKEDVLDKNLNLIIENVKKLVGDANMLTEAALDGRLAVRADASKHHGDYAKIVDGVNATLDAVIEPINEARAVIAKMAVNDYSVKMDGQYNGLLKEFTEDINMLRTRLLNIQDAVINIAKGDTERLQEFRKIERRSENDHIIPAIINMMQTIEYLIKEADTLANSAINGNLNVRGNADKFEGGYKEIIEGMNETMIAVDEPLKEAAAVLEQMANANLQVMMQGDYKGAYAKIKDSVNYTVEAFNQVLNEINTSAGQVASGARQVSGSSQALSQGSTEQASAIEELTASIEEIAAQTKQNAANANQANEFAVNAKNDAEKGNEQMGEMLKSMAEINDASANISKIIKVIDEIAFQTNILALNAAVEAARAGQHGKGFAVVAEEVRNLAARSAGAAKETTDLIESTIKKVEGGTTIANETAEALNKIVDGVSKSTELVGQIAVSSNEQATGIAQINQGVTQISQVVQNNSATSEESASASEELSGQAEMLKEMVGRFKLKNLSLFNKKSYDMNNEEAVVTNNNNNENYKSVSKISGTHSKSIVLNDNNFGKY